LILSAFLPLAGFYFHQRQIFISPPAAEILEIVEIYDFCTANPGNLTESWK